VEAKLNIIISMEQQKIDMFVALNNENFTPQDLITIKQKLEQWMTLSFF
jgi:hypothetical protein